jgi:hypothetical protein
MGAAVVASSRRTSTWLIALVGLMIACLLWSGGRPASAMLDPASTGSPTLACTQLDPRLAAAKPNTEAFGTLARQSLADGCVAYIDTSTSPPSLELAFLRGSLTGTVINIGPLETAAGESVDLTDVALTSSGTLYGVDFGSDLYRVNTGDAVATLIGPLSAQTNGLVVSPEGTLYASGGYELYTVNLATGSATYVGTTGYASSGDLAFTPDGSLLMSAESASPNDSLVKLSLTTAYGSMIGSIGQGAVYGLAESYGTLFAATASGELLTVDPSSGASSVLAAGGDLSANGMAVPPQATTATESVPSSVPTVSIASSSFSTTTGSEKGSVVLSCAHKPCSGAVRVTRVVGSTEAGGAGKKGMHSEEIANAHYKLSRGETRTVPLTFTALGSRLVRQGLSAGVQGTLVVSVKGGPYTTVGVNLSQTASASSSTTTTTATTNSTGQGQGQAAAACPSASQLLTLYDSDPSNPPGITGFTTPTCWSNWVVAFGLGQGNGSIVFSTTGGLHVATTAENGTFHDAVCSDPSAPSAWRGGDIAGCD